MHFPDLLSHLQWHSISLIYRGESLCVYVCVFGRGGVMYEERWGRGRRGRSLMSRNVIKRTFQRVPCAPSDYSEQRLFAQSAQNLHGTHFQIAKDACCFFPTKTLIRLRECQQVRLVSLWLKILFFTVALSQI